MLTQYWVLGTYHCTFGDVTEENLSFIICQQMTFFWMEVRTTPAKAQCHFNERCSFGFTFDFNQTVVEAFWKRCVQEFFPNLVVWLK